MGVLELCSHMSIMYNSIRTGQRRILLVKFHDMMSGDRLISVRFLEVGIQWVDINLTMGYYSDSGELAAVDSVGRENHMKGRS